MNIYVNPNIQIMMNILKHNKYFKTFQELMNIVNLQFFNIIFFQYLAFNKNVHRGVRTHALADQCLKLAAWTTRPDELYINALISYYILINILFELIFFPHFYAKETIIYMYNYLSMKLFIILQSWEYQDLMKKMFLYATYANERINHFKILSRVLKYQII